MSENTLKLTQGALITAVFGVLMFLNRQTAGMAEEILVYVFPLPMAIYTAKYGTAAGLPAFAAMTLLSFLLGTPASAIYAAMYVAVGLVFGTCLHKKADSAVTMLAVMVSATAVNIINLVFLASLTGISFSKEVEEYRNMIREAAAAAGVTFPEQILSFAYLGRLLFISMTAVGALQGFLICQIGLLIMRKLRQNVPAPRGFFDIHPPVMTGYAAASAFLVYTFVFGIAPENSILQTAVMALGLFGYLYLLFFGFAGAVLIFRGLFGGHRILSSVLSLIAVFLLPLPLAVLGFVYISYQDTYINLLKKTGGF